MKSSLFAETDPVAHPPRGDERTVVSGSRWSAISDLPIWFKIMVLGMIVLMFATGMDYFGLSLMRYKPPSGFTVRIGLLTLGLAAFSVIVAVMFAALVFGFRSEREEMAPRRLGALLRVSLPVKIGAVCFIATLIFAGGMDLFGPHLISLYHPKAGFATRMILTMLCFFVLATLLALALTVFISRPIHELVQAVYALGRGDLKVRARIRAHDEIGRLSLAFNQMADNLGQKETLLLNLVGKVIRAQEEERTRVARELHDRTGQSLTSLILGLKGLESECRSCLVGKMNMESLKALVSQAMEEVHQIAVSLHPSALDELGLFAAIQRQVDVFRKRGKISMDFQVVGFQEGERMPREIEVTLYRILQEAMANAIRHGNANSVNLLIQRCKDSVLAVVEDDGKGFDASQWREQGIQGQHLGLFTMEERANLLNGTFEIESGNGRAGTAVFVRFPIPEGGWNASSSEKDFLRAVSPVQDVGGGRHE